MRIVQTVIIAGLAALILANSALAHCQIPCGIYGDALRFDLMREHIQTIQKSMKMIRETPSQPGESANQLVRWVNNKEQHADELSHIVTWYFLAQRIKPDTENYHQKLELLHRLQIQAMKCKQSVKEEDVAELGSLVERFEKLYMNREARVHLKEHAAER